VKLFVQKRSALLKDPLRVPFEDYLHVTKRGRWWLVGSAWAGRDQQQQQPSTRESPIEDSKSSSLHSQDTMTSKDPALEKKMTNAARLLHLHTEVRRHIFTILMSSEDYVNAFENLLRFNAKEKQDREIVRVIVQCCSHEKTFNKFYAYLAEKLCQHDHDYKITFRFCFWDFWKKIHQTPTRQIVNMAKLLVHLVITYSLPLSIMKAADFLKLSHQGILFFQLVFSGILTSITEPHDIVRVFESVLLAKELESTRQGFLFFFHQHMKDLPFMDKPSGVILDDRLRLAMGFLEGHTVLHAGPFEYRDLR
jgi:nucleolar MIF4G domain-containing protein 1